MTQTKAKIKNNFNQQKRNKQKKDKPWVVFDVNIKVFNDGQISIDAPTDLVIFREIITQAERIMTERYGPKKTDGKVVQLNPKIQIARR